jgi:shikimate kinase
MMTFCFNEKKNSRLVLVGSMGAGKTTIGKILAARMELPFFDTDDIVESSAGAEISWIFEREGEQGFRRRENEALRHALENESCIIATGGGIVLDESNRLLLKECATVVYLYLQVQDQLKRLLSDSKRPLIQCDNREEVLCELFKQRDPLYKEVSDKIVTVNDNKPSLTINKILTLLRA